MEIEQQEKEETKLSTTHPSLSQTSLPQLLQQQQQQQFTNSLTQQPQEADHSLINYFQQNMKKLSRTILNRRYKKLQELIDKDEYFSEDEIKLRDPLLYFLYCGQYKRDVAIASKDRFSEMLMDVQMNEEYNILLKQAYDSQKDKTDYPHLYDLSNISQEDQEDNEDELIQLMHIKFLAGADHQFINYKEIDDNEFYDDLKTINQDQEDHYFDEQVEEGYGQAKTVYTGQQDF